jgi:hypothetical protein
VIAARVMAAEDSLEVQTIQPLVFYEISQVKVPNPDDYSLALCMASPFHLSFHAGLPVPTRYATGFGGSQ